MKIFRIKVDVNKFQKFLPADQSIWVTDALNMNCKPKLPEWKAPEIYIHNPIREAGNFYGLCAGAFVVDSLAAEDLRTMLEMGGELLPLEHQGQSFFLFNTLECVNCLDQERTKWELANTGVKIRILEHQFFKNRLGESTLFKIPETLAEVLCVEGITDPEEEFKAQVEARGFKGLKFEELWSDGE